MCVYYRRGSMKSPLSLPLARSLSLTHTHTVQRRWWRRQRDSLLSSLRQKDLRPPCCCLGESARQRTPEAGRGTAKGSSEMAKASTASKQFLAGNNRLLSRLRAHLQCAANFTQSRAEREKAGWGERKRLLPVVPGLGAEETFHYSQNFQETNYFPDLLKEKKE